MGIAAIERSKILNPVFGSNGTGHVRDSVALANRHLAVRDDVSYTFPRQQ